MAVLEVVQRRSSVLEHITALLHHTQNLYLGTALRVGKKGLTTMAPVDLTALASLVDELENALTDEFGNILIDGVLL